MTATKNILITGANRGIGLALTERLVAKNHRVWATHRPGADCQALEALQQQASQQLQLLPLDVSSLSDCQALSRHLGDLTIDVLWNNAGVFLDRDANISQLDFDQYATMLDVNTLGPLRVIQSLLPQLQRSQAAKILTLSSVMGSIASRGRGGNGYRTSKAALNRALVTVAEDLRRWRMTVLCLHPGWVRTDMGGQDASIEVNESAQGLIDIMERCQFEDSGQFWDYRGQRIDW